MRVAEPNLEQQHNRLGDTPLAADPFPHGARVHAEFLGRAYLGEPAALDDGVKPRGGHWHAARIMGPPAFHPH
jgi:hypothetical protein